MSSSMWDVKTPEEIQGAIQALKREAVDLPVLTERVEMCPECFKMHTPPADWCGDCPACDHVRYATVRNGGPLGRVAK